MTYKVINPDYASLVELAGGSDVSLSLSGVGTGTLPTSYLTTLFVNKQLVTNQIAFFDDAEVSGSGTSSVFSAPYTTLKVSSGVAGKRVRQSKQWFNYQPGRVQRIFQTFVLGSLKTGIRKRVGYFNDNDGLFLEASGTTLNFVVRKGGVDTPYPQSGWSVDKMNGSGASGITLATTSPQILLTEFLWLGVDGFSFSFDIGRTIYKAHEVSFTNTYNSVVYMNNPNLPLRYEIENIGGVAASGSELELVVICGEVDSIGGDTDIGDRHTIHRSNTGLTTLNDSDLYPLIAIRLNSSYKMATVYPVSLSILCSTGTNYRYDLLLNPTVGGTALTYAQWQGSCVDVAVTATNATKVSGGTSLESRYVSQAGAQIGVDLGRFFSLGTTIAGTSDVLVLAVQRFSNQAETFYASLTINQKV